MSDQQAKIEWDEGGVPVAQHFDDPYFSLQGGLGETRHVFLAGNDLPARFVPGFCIAELGFGTGLNFLTTLLAWRQMGLTGKFDFHSFEAHPMVTADMARALALFPELTHLAREFLDNWQGIDQTLHLNDATLYLHLGDARETLPAWELAADAWFLDGFSPAKNPEMWGADLMCDVARHTRAGGTVATYTAAGAVRRALDDAGFDVTRAPGFGRKRHMTRARLREQS